MFKYPLVVTIDTNIFDAGWEISDFNFADAMVVLNAAITETPINMLEDNIDFTTGKLADGLTIVTVDITVNNLNTEDTQFGPAANVFGSDVLYLVNAKTTVQKDSAELPAYNSAACSCEKTYNGQSAWVYIAPGGSARYKLAYIADDYVSLDNGFVASYNRLMEGVCFYPLSFAEEGAS